MAHPTGVALARPIRSHRLPPGSRLLLAGDQFARGLSPPLRRLCADRDVSFRFLSAKPKDVPTAFAGGELGKQVDRVVAEAGNYRPQVTLVSLPWPELMTSDKLDWAARRLGRGLRALGSSVAWLRPPTEGEYGPSLLRSVLDRAKMPSFHSEALGLAMGPDGETPTVAGYAGWAGALWRWLR